MTPLEIPNKKLRALANSLRENCVYRSSLTLFDGSNRFPVHASEFIEEGFRDLEEIKFLIVTSQTNLPKNVKIFLKDKEEIYSVELSLFEAKDSMFRFSICFKNAQLENRRLAPREKFGESYFVPALLYLNDESYFPVSIYARLIDSNVEAVSFDLRIPLELNSLSILDANIFSHGELISGKNEKIKIDLVRDYRVEHQSDGVKTFATVVASLNKSNEFQEQTSESSIQDKNGFELSMKVFLKDSSSTLFNVKKILKDGFYAESKSRSQSLPNYFLAESMDHHFRFSVTRIGSDYRFKMISDDFGMRVQWYNFISEKVLSIQTRFSSEDVQDVSRLMLESGIYVSRAMSNVVLLHDYFRSNWPLEETLSKTKFRWFVRDKTGAVIGHTAGLRVSDTLWAAVDNIGSQSYDGSWNREFVSKWITAFSEILDHGNKNVYVQWTYNPASNIWNEFHQRIKLKNPEYIDSETTFSFSVFDNREIALNKRDSGISIRNISFSEIPILDLNTSRLVERLLNNGLENFERDFERDYGFGHIRYWKEIVVQNEKFICTYSNYPSWASINRGHDWTYLIPLHENCELSSESEVALIETIKEDMLKNGCHPFQVALVSEKIKLRGGKVRININVAPKALLEAAKTIEVER